MLAGALVVAGRPCRGRPKASPNTLGQNRAAGRGRADSLPPACEWAIIERMSEGLVVLNDLLQPVAANHGRRELLGFPEGLFRLAFPPMRSERWLDWRSNGRDGVEEIVSIWFPARRTLRVRAEPLEPQGGVVVVIEDVTEELKTQRMRREFVAHASHELKSPVASMQTLAEALRHAVREDPARADRFADRIEFESATPGPLDRRPSRSVPTGGSRDGHRGRSSTCRLEPDG